MKTSDLIVNTLLNAGTDKIFSLSGNQIMPVYDAVIDKEIEIIQGTDENESSNNDDEKNIKEVSENNSDLN